jgi:hypothetical protein
VSLRVIGEFIGETPPSPNKALRSARPTSAVSRYAPKHADTPTTAHKTNANTFTALTIDGIINANTPPKDAPAATQQASPPVTGSRNFNHPIIFVKNR